MSLDLIKRRLDKGVYKRLDRFQEDVFSCLERARKLSRTDSQPFEDSVELQAFFLRTRDDVTRSGDLLHSPALNYTLLDLSAQVAELKRVKIEQEISMPAEDESCDGNDKVSFKLKLRFPLFFFSKFHFFPPILETLPPFLFERTTFENGVRVQVLQKFNKSKIVFLIQIINTIL